MTASIGSPEPWAPAPDEEDAYVAEVDGVDWRLALVTDGAPPPGWRLSKAAGAPEQFVQIAGAARPLEQVFDRATRVVGWSVPDAPAGDLRTT